MSGDKPTVFFDGVCGLCNRFVDWALKRDKKGDLLFTPIQGKTAQKLLGPLPEDPQAWTIIYKDEEGLHKRSTAVLRIIRKIGGLSKIWLIFGILPALWRDGLYRFVARRRYKWFGQKQACRLPSAEEKNRFLP